MAKHKPKAAYAVCYGRKVGVFTDWEEVKVLVNELSNAVHKGFSSLEEAQAYYDANYHNTQVSIALKIKAVLGDN